MFRRTRGRTLSLLWTATACVTFFGCGPSGTYINAINYNANQAPPHPTRVDIIKINDTVSVKVFGQEQMSVTGKVRPDGTLAIPLLGEYPVVGKKPASLAEELRQRMSPYVASPNVTVMVEDSPVRVTVIGETGSGLQSLEWPLIRLVDALAAAGGPNEYANRSAIFVLRGALRIRFDYDDIITGAPHAKDFLMQTGDIVVVE